MGPPGHRRDDHDDRGLRRAAAGVVSDSQCGPVNYRTGLLGWRGLRVGHRCGGWAQVQVAGGHVPSIPAAVDRGQSPTARVAGGHQPGPLASRRPGASAAPVRPGPVQGTRCGSAAAARDVQGGSPVPADRVARAAREPGPDLAVEPVPLPLVHGDMARERTQHGDVALPRRRPVPSRSGVPPSRGTARPPRSRPSGPAVPLGGASGSRRRAVLRRSPGRRPGCPGRTGRPRPGTRAARSRKPAGPQGAAPPGPAVADGGINPVPGRRGVDQGGLIARPGPPVLEPFSGTSTSSPARLRRATRPGPARLNVPRSRSRSSSGIMPLVWRPLV